MRRYAIALPALMLCACVTPAKFKASQGEAEVQRRRADTAETRLAEAGKAIEAEKAARAAAAEAAAKVEQDLTSRLKAVDGQFASAKASLDSTGAQLASVQKSNKDLQESLEAKKGELTKKVSDLVKEKDELAAKLAEASSALGARTQELARARSELAALEKAKAEELAKARAETQAIEQAKEAELSAVKKNYEDLTASLKSEISAGEVTITQLKGKLTVNMVDRILFDSGQAEVRPAGKKVLERVGAVLAGVKDKDIRIEGHTDNKPIGGDLRNKYATNWELSTARATAVARHLQDQAKVDPRRLVAAGYGEFRPVASNETAESRALNRRIEIVLVPRD